MATETSELHPDVLAARDHLLAAGPDYAALRAGFAWPRPEQYNFATDWFDGLAAERGEQPALWITDGSSDEVLSFADLALASRRAAAFLAGHGIKRGDRLLLVLGNTAELWVIMLAAMRLGAVIIPATPQLPPGDLADRVERGRVSMIIAHDHDAEKFAEVDGAAVRVAVGDETPDGWTAFAEAAAADPEDAPEPARPALDDPLLLYFTSGTTARPKLVEHTAGSYPIGHLSTMHWLGVQPGDVHLSIASPGWAKHAWSNVFAPWLAGATVLVFIYDRFDAGTLLNVLAKAGVNTFCAPPTVWRMLVQADLGRLDPAATGLRELLSAGEPLNPEVISQVRAAWGLTIRDGYGQTETSAQVANPPNQPLREGSMGRPLPGFEVVLIDPVTGEERTDEGELCLRLDPRPLPLMRGYRDTANEPSEELNAAAFAGGVYHTGDVVSADDDGYLTYVGRADDVFKASDYRISPFELESVLIEHPAVAEAAIVPAPDETRLAVPKAYVVLAAGHEPDAETARDILGYARTHLAPYKRIRRLEFAELPKTISGKIRRVDLRTATAAAESRPDGEFRDSDFDW